jgi:hypothetical protein
VGIFDNDPDAQIFSTYGVTLRFRDRVMGGTPKDAKIIEGWLRSKAGLTERGEELRQATLRTLLELGADVRPDMTFQEMEEASHKLAATKQTNGFKVGERGLYLEGRTVKAMIKENTNILFAGEEGWGKTKKGARNFVAERVFVNPDQIWLGVLEPTGVEMFIGHTSGPKGPQSNLTYYEYVERATIDFEVIVTLDGVKQDNWKKIWRQAQDNGLGALRSQGFGRFDILRWEKLDQRNGVVRERVAAVA